MQAGDNPRVVADKLLAFVPPVEREADQEAGGASRPAVAEAA